MSSEHNNPRNPIRIGSRGSQLALWQANHILYALRDAGYHVELEVIRTTGDRMQQPGFVPPPNLDGKGIFIKEIEEALEEGRIDTTSPRRRAQILALRPDVTFVEVRGNIDTRLRKLEQGQCDALVLAAAGLDRLKRTESVHYRFAPEEICPAPGQGALALETRSPSYPATHQPDESRDAHIRNAIAFLEHPHTRFAVDAERTTLDALGGGC